MLYCGIINGQQRLTLSKDELSAKKCEIVTQYFELKKYVGVITNLTEEPRIRNSNEIALFRLLHPDFTTDEMNGGNREIFIHNLKTNSDLYKTLQRTYELFDCPNTNLVSELTPDDKDLNDELTMMDITTENNSLIYTTLYEGFMLYAQTDLNSYEVEKTLITKKNTGITKRQSVKRLRYQIYKLADDECVLKIKSIDDVTKSGVPTEISGKKNKTDTIIVYKRPDPEKFKPCCSQTEPPDTDGDGYNDLVDCDIRNPLIKPGAREIVGDGIDQNCDGVDQLGDDNDQDGYYSAACKSPDPEVRKLCDCNDDDEDIYRRKEGTPESEWYNPGNGWNDDNCDCIKDREKPFLWEPVSTSNLLIPGKGHLLRGKSKTARFTRFSLYGGVFLASATYATYSKIQSEKFYKKHINSETFRTSKYYYDNANLHHKRFVVSTGVAVLSYIANYFHLKVLDNREKQYKNELHRQDQGREIDSKEYCRIRLAPEIGINSYCLGLKIDF